MADKDDGPAGRTSGMGSEAMNVENPSRDTGRDSRAEDFGVTASDRARADAFKDSMVTQEYGGWDAFNSAVRSIEHRSIGERMLGLRETMVQGPNGVVTTEWSGIDFSPIGTLAGMALGGPVGMLLGAGLASIDPMRTTIGFDGTFSPYTDPLAGAGKAVMTARAGEKSGSSSSVANVIASGGIPIGAGAANTAADIRDFFARFGGGDKIKLPPA
jgi:hypothetical protein